jgi:hypothetical protein
MDTLIVTAEGQITLSDDLLQHLGVQCGLQICVEKLSDSRIVIKAFRPTGNISDVFGSLKRKGSPSLSVDEISQIAAQGWVGKR